MAADHSSAAPVARQASSPFVFILLTFALAVPFWIGGGLSGGLQLMPGLPVAGLMFVCPGSAALLLVGRSQGGRGIGDLLGSSFDIKRVRNPIWWAPVLLIMPAQAGAAFLIQRCMGIAVPDPQIGWLNALSLCLVFSVSAIGEELGWTAYATEPLQARFGPLGAGLFLGAAWAVIHFIPLAQAHRSWEWIAWWTLGTVSMRVIMVWLYDGGGRSVAASALFHTTINVTWQLYPIHGSYFDPRLSGLILAGVGAVAGTMLLRARPARRAA